MGFPRGTTQGIIRGLSTSTNGHHTSFDNTNITGTLIKANKISPCRIYHGKEVYKLCFALHSSHITPTSEFLKPLKCVCV